METKGKMLIIFTIYIFTIYTFAYLFLEGQRMEKGIREGRANEIQGFSSYILKPDELQGKTR